MQEKFKIITIGDYKNSTLEDYFKDNQNIEFLKLSLNENTEKLKDNLFKNDIIFLRTNENNLEKLLEVAKSLKEKEIITVTILEEKIVIENKKVLEDSINALFPITKKEDNENLLLEILKMFNNILFTQGFINLDFEDIKSMLKDLGIATFGTININGKILEKELVNTINYSFYNKSVKGSKVILIHLDTWQNVGMLDSQTITDILRNESGKNMDEIMFSVRIDDGLENRIECSFIAGKFSD